MIQQIPKTEVKEESLEHVDDFLKGIGGHSHEKGIAGIMDELGARNTRESLNYSVQTGTELYEIDITTDEETYNLLGDDELVEPSSRILRSSIPNTRKTYETILYRLTE